ncbi:hypothetical protein [Sphingomonas jatrophae]|uniref:Uncharacterized protein n=1 Tax=Sphingomonas jatrophae TaxID=1166337 RepID=A0A1I6JYN7_9SPHN|nr:hypothetical protein [Sphingomonas jatrophae]SFR84061.1 hypothetical protein SAMN05192580_1087 [Sphingomonas jatrophae]
MRTAYLVLGGLVAFGLLLFAIERIRYYRWRSHRLAERERRAQKHGGRGPRPVGKIRVAKDDEGRDA